MIWFGRSQPLVSGCSGAASFSGEAVGGALGRLRTGLALGVAGKEFGRLVSKVSEYGVPSRRSNQKLPE